MPLHGSRWLSRETQLECVTLAGWRSRFSRCPCRCWSSSSTAGEPCRERKPTRVTARPLPRSPNVTPGRRPALPRLRGTGRSRTRKPRHRPVDEVAGPARARRGRRPDPTHLVRHSSARCDRGGRRRHAARSARRARPRAPGYLCRRPLRRRLRGRVAGRASTLLLGHVPEPRARRSLPPPQVHRLTRRRLISCRRAG